MKDKTTETIGTKDVKIRDLPARPRTSRDDAEVKGGASLNLKMTDVEKSVTRNLGG